MTLSPFYCCPVRRAKKGPHRRDGVILSHTVRVAAKYEGDCCYNKAEIGRIVISDPAEASENAIHVNRNVHHGLDNTLVLYMIVKARQITVQ